MYFTSKAILSSTVSLLLVLSSYTTAADQNNNKLLRGNIVDAQQQPSSETAVMHGRQEAKRREELSSTNSEEKDLVPIEDMMDEGSRDKHDELIMDTSHIEEGETRELSHSPYHSNEDITIYNGVWGGWKPWMKTYTKGYYACGAELKFEGSQGVGDDTAANGLKLRYCDLNNWYYQQEQTIWHGNWGDWKGWVMCPYGKYIGAAAVRFEDPIGSGDDTALNGLAIWCVDKHWYHGEAKVVYGGYWGGWKPWAYKVGKLVKGARVRYEDPIGWGDDTAMNGIQFNVEYPGYN